MGEREEPKAIWLDCFGTALPPTKDVNNSKKTMDMEAMGEDE